MMQARREANTIAYLWQRAKRASTRRGRGRSPHQGHVRLGSESLESRAMLSADGMFASVTADDVAVDGSGNSYLFGSFRGTVDFDPGAGVLSLTSTGPRDGYLAKFDAAGTALWVQPIASPASAIAFAVDVDASGTVAVGGRFSGTASFDPSALPLTSAGGSDGFLAVYSDAGVFQWSESIGGSRSDSVLDVALDGSSGIVAVGETDAAVPFRSDSQGFVAARTADGGVRWNRSITATRDASAVSVAVSGSGDIVLGGSFEGTLTFGSDSSSLVGQGREDGFVAVLDGSTGATVWSQAIGGAGEDAVSAVTVSDTGSIAIGGQLELPSGDPSVPVGDLDHDGDDDRGDHDGDHDEWEREDDREQGFAAVLTAAGATQWSRTLAAESDVHTVAFDTLGGVTIGGSFEGRLALDPATANTVLSSRGREAGFVMQLDAQGVSQWATPFDGGRTRVNGLAVDAAGNTLVASTGGIFRSGVLTELAPGGKVIRSDAFVAAGKSKWHRHDGDSNDDRFEDEWDDDGPSKPATLPASVVKSLPVRISFDDAEPLFLSEDDAERDRVRQSLENRDASPDDLPYDFRKLTPSQLALLQAWSAYSADGGDVLPPDDSGTGSDDNGADDDHDHGVGDDDHGTGNDDHGTGDDDHGNGDHDDDDHDNDDHRDDNHGKDGSTTAVVFDAAGYATLTGTVAGEHAKQRFSFVASTNGSVSVVLSPDANGHYPEVEVENASTGREMLELEPHERRGSTSGTFAVVAGQTYVLEVEAPEDWMTVNYSIQLQLV